MQETAITRARQKLREALYANRNDLAVAEVVDAIEEYVTARLAAARAAKEAAAGVQF